MVFVLPAVDKYADYACCYYCFKQNSSYCQTDTEAEHCIERPWDKLRNAKLICLLYIHK